MPNTLTRTYAFRLINVCFLLLLASSQLAAQTDATTTRISIIPKPRELTTTTEPFRLERDAHLSLADPKSTDDQFAAADFIDDVKQTAGVTLKTGRSRRKAILIGQLDLPAVQAA